MIDYTNIIHRTSDDSYVIWARDGVRAWPRRVVDGLFFWQREHCKSSYESEKCGRQLPPELRNRGTV